MRKNNLKQIKMISQLTLILMLLAGCGATPTTLSQKMEVGEVKGDATPLLKEADELWKSRGERAKAEQAIAKWEEAAKQDPSKAVIPLKLVYGYYFMAHVHDRWVDDAEEKMEAWYSKGMKAGERAIFLQNGDFKNMIEADEKWEKAVKTVKKEGIDSLYWYATNLGKWSLIQGIVVTLGNKGRIKSTMEQVLSLDETFFHGAPHRYFGVYEAKIPGGDITKSGQSFDKAIEISPDYLDTYVLKAQYFAAKTQNEELFKSLLNKVMEADATKIPELKIENTNAQRIAKKMLSNIEDFF